MRTALIWLYFITSIWALDISTDLVRVEFNETSPDIYFYLVNTTDTFYKLAWKGLFELDEDSVTVARCEFGSNFTYTEQRAFHDRHGRLIMNTNMTTWVHLEPQTVALQLEHYLNMNRSVPVTDEDWLGLLQFKFSTERWPFQSTNNRLQLHMSLSTHNRSETRSSYDNDRHTLLVQRARADFLEVYYPPTCEVEISGIPKVRYVNVTVSFDNEKESSTVSHDQQNSARFGGAGTEVAISFPYFRRLNYSSTISISFRANWAPFLPETLGTGIIIFLVVVGGVLVVFGLGTAFLTWHRHHVRRYYLEY